MTYKIALDAGHGLNTAGKRCAKAYDKNETREWLLNSRIASKIVAMLGEYQDVDVLRVDDVTGKTDVSLATRCKAANNFKANIYISIHHNAGGGSGVVVYRYLGLSATGDTARLQRTIYNSLVEGNGNKGNRSTPLGTADFAVLRDTSMPAALIENGFMDHPVDVPLILSDAYAEKSARGIVAGIAEYAGLIKKPVPVPDDTEQMRKQIAVLEAQVLSLKNERASVIDIIDEIVSRLNAINR